MGKDLNFFMVLFGLIASVLQAIANYLDVDYGVIKVFFWVYVISICFGTIKTILLRQSYQEFLIRNWLLKTMLLVVPTLAAIEVHILPLLKEFVEWFFYYFILAETSYILSCILSLHKKKDVTTSFSIGGLEIILDKISITLEKLMQKLEDKK